MVRSERSVDTRGPSSPAAARQSRTRWRDPRLWFGVILVLVSVVVGAKVVASADDTVGVWQVAHDVRAGEAIQASDLTVTDVHFDQSSAAVHYVTASVPLAPGARATRDLTAGELLTTSAFSTTPAAPVRQLPLGVSPLNLPPDLQVGDRVDVWAVPAASVTGHPSAGPELVVPDVMVLALGGSGIDVSGQRQVLVGVDANIDLGHILSLTSGSRVVLVRRGS